jgi:hypothetical protein
LPRVVQKPDEKLAKFPIQFEAISSAQDLNHFAGAIEVLAGFGEVASVRLHEQKFSLLYTKL